MTRTQLWIKLYEQQEVVRTLIKQGQGNTEEFWRQHEMMERMRELVCKGKNFK